MTLKNQASKTKSFKIRLKKGDLVQVLSGKYKGKQGKVTQVICSYDSGVNFVHRTRAQCQMDGSTDCAANPASCKANCN